MNSRSHFRRGATPIFNCAVCGRRTRHVEYTDSPLCPECLELAGWDNQHNDDGSTPTADEMRVYEGLVKKAEKRGSNAEAMRKNFPFIWRKA